jgi:hypothetical protein
VDEEPTSGKDYEYILEEMLRGLAFTEVTITVRGCVEVEKKAPETEIAKQRPRGVKELRTDTLRRSISQKTPWIHPPLQPYSQEFR